MSRRTRMNAACGRRSSRDCDAETRFLRTLHKILFDVLRHPKAVFVRVLFHLAVAALSFPFYSKIVRRAAGLKMLCIMKVQRHERVPLMRDFFLNLAATDLQQAEQELVLETVRPQPVRCRRNQPSPLSPALPF